MDEKDATCQRILDKSRSFLTTFVLPVFENLPSRDFMK